MCLPKTFIVIFLESIKEPKYPTTTPIKIAEIKALKLKKITSHEDIFCFLLCTF
jgi:hypothetical protein